MLLLGQSCHLYFGMRIRWAFYLLFFMRLATLIWWLWASVGGVRYANVIDTIGLDASSELLCGVAWPCVGLVLFVGGVSYLVGSGTFVLLAMGVLGASSVYASLLLFSLLTSEWWLSYHLFIVVIYIIHIWYRISWGGHAISAGVGCPISFSC